MRHGAIVRKRHALFEQRQAYSSHIKTAPGFFQNELLEIFDQLKRCPSKCCRHFDAEL
jgi:hypothetical protein